MVSVDDLLKLKIIQPDHIDYRIVPMMALWYMKCPKCKAYLVSSHRIGVDRRYDGHMRTHYPNYGLDFESGRCYSCHNTYDVDILTDGAIKSLKNGSVNCPRCGKELKPERR